MTRPILFAVTLAIFVTACNRPEPAAPEPTPTETQEVQATQSIFGPEAGITPVPELLEPLSMRVTFEENGRELSEAIEAELATVLESPQYEAGGPITLRGHTDSAGGDAANIRASRARAEAVRDWLVERGVAEDRIEVIAFGEQNPIEPNALPDGSPNEEGRAANRRVELEIGVDSVAAETAPDADPDAAENEETDVE